MDSVLLIALLILGILVLVGALLAAFVLKKRKESNPREVNYKAFLILGICLMPVGIPLAIATKNPGLFGISGLGVCYLAIGLANKDKWKK